MTDETMRLLLQLAESLRKTMRLDCAEVYTGAGDVLERAVSVPDASGKSIVLTDRERPVVARAGVSGSAWASVWLPALLDGREQAQLRVVGKRRLPDDMAPDQMGQRIGQREAHGPAREGCRLDRQQFDDVAVRADLGSRSRRVVEGAGGAYSRADAVRGAPSAARPARVACAWPSIRSSR